MHTRSRSVYSNRRPTNNALLTRLWWLSVAPFGEPVVPLVYWMFAATWADMGA